MLSILTEDNKSNIHNISNIFTVYDARLRRVDGLELIKVIGKLKREHKLIKHMLINSIKIVLEESGEVYLKDRSRFLQQASAFLNNYCTLVRPHFQFEEQYLFTALPKKYSEKVEQWKNEHRYILELIERANDCISKCDIAGVLNILRELYKVETRHTADVDEAIAELTKSLKNIQPEEPSIW